MTLANRYFGMAKLDDTLSHVFHKRPFFNEGNVQAMNLLLDKVQGAYKPTPHWVESTRDLLVHDPQTARLRALAGLVSELNQLQVLIEKVEKKDTTLKPEVTTRPEEWAPISPVVKPIGNSENEEQPENLPAHFADRFFERQVPTRWLN